MAAIDRLSGDYQRAVGELVSREVHYGVSSLIHHLAQDDMGEYYDDILLVCVTDDWQSAAEDAGWEHFTDEFGANCYRDTNDGQSWACELNGWQMLCEEFGIEPYQTEALEHWIVSDWLADKLAERGEMISKDIYGLTIWGRVCTGQAILLDDVICQIYDALHK